MSEIGATETTGLLGSTSLLVAVGFGPLFLAPISERYGRKWTIIGSFALFAILWIPEALATNMAGIIVIVSLVSSPCRLRMQLNPTYREQFKVLLEVWATRSWGVLLPMSI